MVTQNKRWVICIISLIVMTLLVSFIALCSGSVGIAKKDIVQILFERLKGDPMLTNEATIILKIRIPRILLGFMVGGALALAGVILQALFRNPLVEPYTLGISGGASLAVSVSIVCGYSHYLGLPFVGFIGALSAISVVYTIGRKFRNINIAGLLLTGVMFSFICSSLIMLIMSIAKAEQAHGILFWLMGNLEQNNPFLLKMICFIIPAGALLSFLKAWSLNALSLGDEEALHLGINVEQEKQYLFIVASLMTGVAVSVSGIIGFVGLVVPHFMRMYVGTDHRILMPSSFLLGGIFLTVCDTAARTIIAPTELPVGVITGLVGGTIFLYFLIRETKRA